MLILLGLMAVLESVLVFLLPSGIEPLVAIGRAALGLLKSRTGSTLAKAVSAAFVLLWVYTGYCLLLGLMMTILDSFLKQVDALTRNINVLKKQAKGAQEEYLRLQSEQQLKKSKDEELAAAMEIKSLKDVVSDLQNKLERLQLDANSKEKEVKVLKKASCLEYNQLMDDNESLHNQLAVFDRKHSTLESKKKS
ncbi:hypothetical protein BDL97_03G009200 [Sphagnum fallax]|nr:hypothetical protein BDL97_03G009200 [Sphagnum fallax]